MNNIGILMNRIFCSLFLFFLFTSCSSSLMIPEQNDFQSNLNKINYLGSSNSSQIYLLDNTMYNSSNLNISNDSLIFTNIENDSVYNISVEQLSKIIINDKTASTMGGIWVGLGSATIASIISSKKTGDSQMGTAIVAAIAAVVGYIYGSSYTGEKEFIFNEY